MLQQTWYLHTLEADKSSYCPNSLEQLRSREWVLESFYSQDLVIYESKYFIVTLKNAPYSNKDLFIIYSWENQNISSLDNLSNREFEELIWLLENIYLNLSKKYNFAISSWDLELILGLNTSVIPWPWMVQSVYRPHFHITLLNTISWVSDNIKTDVINIISDCDKQKSMYCFREENHEYIQNFLSNLKLNLPLKNWNILYWVSFLQNKDYIDIFLPESYLFHNENIYFIKEIYKQLNNYLLSNKTDVLSGIKNNFWFSIWFKKSDNWITFRVKFFVKRPWDNWWSMEMFYHSIQRKRVEKPNLPDMTEWRDEIKSFF